MTTRGARKTVGCTLGALALTLALTGRVCADADDAVPTADAAAPTPTAAEHAAVEGASPVTVRARLEPDTTTIGTPFRYTMEVAAPTGVQIVLAQPTERLGDFDILDFGDAPPLTRDATTVITRWYRLAGWEPGHYEIASPPVEWRRPGEELAAAPPAKVVMTIDSVLAKADAGAPTDIRDIRPPIEPPFYWRPYYVGGAALAVVVATALLAYRLLRRRERAAAGVPPRPAHEIAIEDLERLRGRRLTDHGLFKEYYSALSGIVRAYLERRFAVRAPEMTTEEFLLTSARGGRLQSTHRALLSDFLSESDLVKFARHVPTIADSERAYAAARRFVDETVAPRAGADGEGDAAR
jgi:hypothetical protein